MIRGAGIVAALALAAFFALAARQATSTDAARARLTTAAPTRGTATLLRHASTLNPDRSVDVLQARLALAQNDPARARSILLDIVTDEPANLEAWAVIALAFQTRDPQLAARAHAALLRLAPPVPQP